MKKLQEMIAERATKNEAFQKMELTEETRDAFDAAELELSNLDEDIKRLEKQEERNAAIASTTIISNHTKDTDEVNYHRALNEYFVKGVRSSEFMGNEGLILPKSLVRAEPVLTTTDTGIINKIVDPTVDVKKSYGMTFLQDTLGVRTIEGVQGNLVLPSMAESIAYNSLENVDTSTANQAPSSITLAAQRVDYFQGYTREFLAQTSTYNSLVQDLVDGIGVKHVSNFFDAVDADIIDSSIAQAGGSLAYADLLNLEAAIADNFGNAQFVTTPAVKAYLRNLNAGSANIKFAWSDDGQVIGYPAHSASACNTGKLIFGDFSKATMATFGTGMMEIVIDPYTSKKNGVIEVYAVELADYGVANPRHFATMDASI